MYILHKTWVMRKMNGGAALFFTFLHTYLHTHFYSLLHFYTPKHTEKKTNTYYDMKKILFPAMAAVAVAFASCTSTSTQAPVVYTIDEVYAQADSLSGDTIMFEGVCTHLCKHGGRKAFLVGNLSDTVLTETDTVIRPHILRVEGAKMGNFDAACINNVVRVRGVLHAYEYTPQPVADPAEKHGEGNQGCATEQIAIHGYFAEAVSYEIITAE